MIKDTKAYLLVLLMEEAAEVIHAASKAIRFGLEHDEPGYGNGTNKDQIELELGEVLAIGDLLNLDGASISKARFEKIERLREIEKRFATQMEKANQS
jgi:NTP pyrophosphatase (non-canonical NTP hydrolase)